MSTVGPDISPGDETVPAERRRRGARRPTPALLVAGVVLVALVVGAVVATRDADLVDSTVAGAAPAGADAPEVEGSWATTTSTSSTTTTTTTTMPVVPVDDGLAIAPPLARPYVSSFLVADAKGARVPLYQSPGVPVPSGRAMANPTFEGLSLVFLVRERTTEWLHAQLMSRPNSALAWIRASDVTLRRVPHHIVIERGARRITVYQGEDVVFQTEVATGKASSPTPLGTFFVDGTVRLSPPHRSYGVGQVSFTGFSEVYESFGGGVGQVALHGTQNPALIGTPASNGCVRMRNEDIAQIFDLAPAGTPVEVVA